MANRRKFLAGIGSLAAGSAAAVGTGAFSSVEAERQVSVEVVGDNSAYLGLQAERTDIVSTDGDDGRLTLDLGSQTTNPEEDYSGEGFNDDAVTKIDGIFSIINQGTQSLTNVTVDASTIDGVTFTVQNFGNSLIPGSDVKVDVEVDTHDYDGTAGDQTVRIEANNLN